MSKHASLRPLLPAKLESHVQPRETNQEKRKYRISLACTECRKGRTKRCVAKGCQCIYDPKTDRRRKLYTAEIEQSHVALCRMVEILRSGSPDHVSRFISEIQSFHTTHEAVAHIIGTMGGDPCEEFIGNFRSTK
ncbi:hypothetical protein N7492_008492 [Penicillium capsulatum]|uniref:Zn(2)-C6 fungal-type domain-containing protein n=1 Tax=Penicillium capsulatum TaxID=69766 RepID=A0A9W9HT49_9EURO|nr:hypothetical protein N7492_008473 [Penicillium capsulatum]KAJ5155689.1 hypothetical protein N7492_008492 [Penicillium capsulatum]KAJ6105874.1 hypothetical protein N7512_009391 [Penicillium capsulatum]KAJ6105894.1 hypothetical protein N7512_009411 [Penicillium capsulatum]